VARAQAERFLEVARHLLAAQLPRTATLAIKDAERFTSDAQTELLNPDGQPSGLHLAPIEAFYFVPEPGAGLLAAAALLALAALRRRREAPRRD